MNVLDRLTAGCWVLIGVGHIALQLFTMVSPSPSRLESEAFLSSQEFPAILGLERTALDVSDGVSFMMGAAIVVVGVLLFLGTAEASDRRMTRMTRVVALVASLGAFLISVASLPVMPVILFGLAIVSAGLSLAPRAARRDTAERMS